MVVKMRKGFMSSFLDKTFSKGFLFADILFLLLVIFLVFFVFLFIFSSPAYERNHFLEGLISSNNSISQRANNIGFDIAGLAYYDPSLSRVNSHLLRDVNLDFFDLSSFSSFGLVGVDFKSQILQNEVECNEYYIIPRIVVYTSVFDSDYEVEKINFHYCFE
jgi:hypothetical protein